MIRFIFFIFIFSMIQKNEATLNNSNTHFQKHQPPLQNYLEKISPKNWENRAYLASFPRSGNGWVLELIEEATGIAISSVYPGPDHPQLPPCILGPWGGYYHRPAKNQPFKDPSEEIPFVVKTHFPSLKKMPFDCLPHFLTIRLIRHPIDSFYSYYIWKQNLKTWNSNKDIQKKEPFHIWSKKNKITNPYIPISDLKESITSWKEFQMYWDVQENVLTIRYEDLYENPKHYLQMMLNAIGYSVSQEDIERALSKHPPKGGIFKHLNHFSKDNLQLINKELSNYMSTHGYNI